MPNCKGIKYIGSKPHLIYDPRAQAEANLPPITEHKEDSDINSTGSVGSLAESWDCASVEDPD